ncbi:MAG: S1 RNA-binding domain-containing protein [Firmicutes bacterium]|nr:S1 RNA-binding domain-containing protein [Bacillota bacterium]
MQIETGAVIEGKITGITKFGAFVSLAENRSGMIHISEISQHFVSDIHDFLTIGQTVRVKVLAIDETGRIALSLKRAEKEDTKTKGEAPEEYAPPSRKADAGHNTFEDMLQRFKAESDEKIGDLKRSFDAKRPGSGKKSAGRRGGT